VLSQLYFPSAMPGTLDSEYVHVFTRNDRTRLFISSSGCGSECYLRDRYMDDRLIAGLIQKIGFAFKSLQRGECIPETSVRRLLEALLQRDKDLFFEQYARSMD
jgi:hypothetical protein